jgi:hypothetical protein
MPMDGHRLHYHITIQAGQKLTDAEIEAAIGGPIMLKLPLPNGNTEVYGPACTDSTAEREAQTLRLCLEGKITSSGGMQEHYFQALYDTETNIIDIVPWTTGASNPHESMTDQSLVD